MVMDAARQRQDPRARPDAPAHQQLRPDIQLLRAIAVGAVLLYHLWPHRVPGGFVGVDVFFVISGFLITAHLLQNAKSPQGIRLGRFWANRARRLLPLSSVVLLATAVGTLLFMPASTWLTSMRNIIGSALYVQNWLLANDAVDYLARDQTPSPTQHFWSLSAEEQFYLCWPLLLVAACGVATWLTRRTTLARDLTVQRGALAGVGVVLVASFGYSIWMTVTEPGVAYFATTTRAWEFALGGLVAFLGGNGAGAGSRTRRIRVSASWVGAALILGSVLLITGATPFPGVAAVFPVVGAAMLLWAGDLRGVPVPTGLARFRPLTYLGDISYGIYLWHWPMIVIAPAAVGITALTATGKVVIVVAAVGLAAISKVLIEDPFRYGTFWTARTRRGFYPGLVGIVAVCAVSAGSIVVIQGSATPSTVAQALPASTVTASTDPDAPLIPSIATRSTDHAEMFDCFDFDHSGPHPCSYGAADADVSIAVVGDSHAAHFIPALRELVTKNNWRLTTVTGMYCDGGLTAECGGAQQGFDEVVAAHYDLVLVSTYRDSLSAPDAVVDYLTRLHDAGVPLLPISDVPFHPTSTYACIDASGGDAGRAAACTTPVAEALQDIPDRVGPIADALGIDHVDLDDVFCSADVCQSVIGNVIVYQDSPSSHLTTTFSKLLAPRLDQEIRKALQR